MCISQQMGDYQQKEKEKSLHYYREEIKKRLPEGGPYMPEGYQEKMFKIILWKKKIRMNYR